MKGKTGNNAFATLVLARDLVDEDGNIVFEKDTVINSENRKILQEFDSQDIFVKKISAETDEDADEHQGLAEGHEIQSLQEVQAEQEKQETQAEQEKQGPPSSVNMIREVEKSEEFKEFNGVYKDTTLKIRDIINNIGNGETINLNQLYGLTDNMLKNIKCKSNIFTYMVFLENFDEGTFTHSNNVALLCNIFGTWLNLPLDELMVLTTAGLLHDIGKTRIDQDILNKKGKLTNDEFDQIKKHTLLGYRLLERQDIPKEIKWATLMHHERIDGSGYPIGATDSKIHRFSKIVAICDIYDAMTANRVYRAKVLPFDVIKTFETKCYGELDTKFLLVFLENIAYNYVGNLVQLSTGEKGKIVFINRNSLSRPLIEVGEKIIDLSTNNSILIEEML